MQILIVGNSVIINERIISLIQENGIDALCTATISEDAIAVSKAINPTIIFLVLDFHTKKFLELFKKIKRANREADFILLFDKIESAAAEEYKSLGVNFIFDKYHEFELIPAAINSLVLTNK